MAALERPLADAEGSVVVLVLDGDGQVEVEVGRLVGLRPDLSLIDVLARLQLSARRLGWSIRLRDPSPELQALVDLVGLAGVIGQSGSTLQAEGQAEDREQLGVEEVLPGGDPAA